MPYSDITLYTSLYGDIGEAEFNRLAWQAAKLLDSYTTGIDGVRKLQAAFPTDLDTEESVKRCECALIDLLRRIDNAQKLGEAAATADGVAVSGPISAVSSGTESISYSAGVSAISAAAGDISARNRLIRDTVYEYLSGEKDANGVNLLYMGVYPHVF